MMDVRLVTAEDEFLALRSAWDDLSRRGARQCAFLTHAWFDAAWQWRREAGTLYLLCCWDRDLLVGVAPLVRMRPGGALRPRALEFLSVPDTQLCDIVADAARQDPVATALADALTRRRSDWDVMRLHYLPADSLAGNAFAGAMATRGIRSASAVATGNLYVPLTGTWDQYYATRSRRVKKAVNLAANRLAKSGAVAIEWRTRDAVEATGVDALVAEVADVSARSWKSATGNSLDRRGPNAFIRRLTEHAAARDWLSVWTLRSGGRLLAMEYQLLADGNVYALRSDFDAECEQISPGSHLSRHLLERLFGRGLERYLMGPGENAYKFRWATASDPVLDLTAYGRSPRGRALALWELAVKPPARRLRERLRSLRPPARAEESADAAVDEREARR